MLLKNNKLADDSENSKIRFKDFIKNVGYVAFISLIMSLAPFETMKYC